MRITAEYKKEINEIVNGLSVDDHERIYKEVEALTSKSNPVYSLMRTFHSDEHTDESVSLLEDDCDFQERAGEIIWDLLMARITREYAIGIYKTRHSYSEVA